MTTQPAASPKTSPRRQGAVAFGVLGAAVLMLGASFAAVPLYRLFCQATGYGGTPQVAKIAPATRGERSLTVYLDANVAPGLPWKFEPDVSSVKARTGETVTVFYKLTNMSDQPTAGTAMYNVSPDSAGAWFNKIACFCFEELKVGPRETLELPVVFFLDPALEKDETMKSVEALTLSYTFFGAKGAAPVAAAATKPRL
jgi:cytochrome c oxidase assembly protein subunit 11